MENNLTQTIELLKQCSEDNYQAGSLQNEIINGPTSYFANFIQNCLETEKDTINQLDDNTKGLLDVLRQQLQDVEISSEDRKTVCKTICHIFEIAASGSNVLSAEMTKRMLIAAGTLIAGGLVSVLAKYIDVKANEPWYKSIFK